MKINYRKITAIATSVLMTGMTVGTAMAAGVSASDLGGQGNIAIVYGTSAGVSALDQTQAVNIDSHLRSQMTSSNASSSVTVGSEKITEDQLDLGATITSSSKIPTTIKNNKLNSLVKDKLSWDDGTGSDTYNIHEEIGITDTKMNILTSVDDKKLAGVALSNDNALEYKLVFEDALNTTAVGTADADSLYLNILGKDYEITHMTATSIEVTTSSEVSMAIGQVYTLSNGKTVTLTDVYSDSVEVMVDGKSDVIDNGKTKKINGVRVDVSSVGYHDNAPATSKAILKIGEDITKTFSSGDEYIGQNKDDPLWVWDISNLGSANGYIGVKYNAKITRAADNVAGDSIKYVGNGYVFPDNYAAVTLDKITDAKYQDLQVSFDTVDLFNNSDGSAAMIPDANVIVLTGKNTDTLTVNGHETSKVYLYYNATANYSAFQSYYLDVNGDYTPTNKMRLAKASVAEVANDAVAETSFATIAIGDTNLNATIKESAGHASLVIKNSDDSGKAIVNVTISGTALNESKGQGKLEYIGTTKEQADAGDIYVQGSDVSTEDYSYMDHYGVIVSKGTTVKSEMDSDQVTLSVPEEQVYAQVSVSMGATVSGASAAGNMIFKDSETSSYAGKNVVIVGGSCVNSAAASALGVAAGTCGADFTAKTGVSAGQFLIKKTTLGGNTAIVVAGYEADDTVKAAQYLINKGAIEGVYTTATQEKVVTA